MHWRLQLYTADMYRRASSTEDKNKNSLDSNEENTIKSDIPTMKPCFKERFDLNNGDPGVSQEKPEWLVFSLSSF